MDSRAGWIFIPTDSNDNKGLWFVFHYGEEGAVAFDLTIEHPRIGYKIFESGLMFDDTRTDAEKVVLLGGDMRSDDALIVLHKTQDVVDESHVIDDTFSFLSYNFVLLAGQPPVLSDSANAPSRITLKKDALFVIALGFRVWEGDSLATEVQRGLWTVLPADPEIVFYTSHRERRQKALLKIH